jgi:hypothetical protein
MAEMYAAALKGVMSNLQGFCKSEDQGKRTTCKRAIEEKLIISEVALSSDKKLYEERVVLAQDAQKCFDECRFNGRVMVRECNTVCGNKFIQNIWQRIDVSDFERIATKYA